MSPIAPTTHSQQMAARGRAVIPHLTDHLEQINRRDEKARPSAHRRGYDARWARARKMFLARHPLCVMHHERGRVVASTVVDHVIPHCGDQKRFWDEDNWQALCRPCHDRKTARERNEMRR